MSLFIIGINHKTAAIEVRERIVFEPQLVVSALRELLHIDGVEEAVIVSTCNRTELYCNSADAADSVENTVRQWLCDYHGVGSDIHDCLYVLDQSATISHAFSVASGIDSVVVGEPQILGQMKNAYREAHDFGSAGSTLNRLFQASFAVAKHIRSETDIGASPVSVAYAAVTLARKIFAGFEQHTALLIGAGETMELTARHLYSRDIGRMIIANRHVERARTLAAQLSAFAISLSEIPAHLADADIIISSTASPTPIITRAHIQESMKTRRNRPVFIVDIAVPRDVEQEVGDMANVYLYTVDDLHGVIKDNLEARDKAASQAAEIVAAEATSFELALKHLDAVPTIRGIRANAQGIVEQTLHEAQQMLAADHSPGEVTEFLAKRLSNRIIHAPTHRLRIAGEEGDAALIRAARELFDLGEE